MTNFEYYKEQILEFNKKGEDFCVDRQNGEIRSCNSTCGYGAACLFSHNNNSGDPGNCTTRKLKWLYEEHLEKLTKQERAFLEICKPECYIARDEDDELYLYDSNKPTKRGLSWRNGGEFYNISDLFKKRLLMTDTDRPFSFIKWEDEEPWKVEDLLK